MKGSGRVAAICIGIAIVLLLVSGGMFYGIVFSRIPGGLPIGMGIAAIAFGFVGAMIAVVRERLKEIEEEDTDDYRKY